jgi:hypothetical protein
MKAAAGSIVATGRSTLNNTDYSRLPVMAVDNKDSVALHVPEITTPSPAHVSAGHKLENSALEVEVEVAVEAETDSDEEVEEDSSDTNSDNSMNREYIQVAGLDMSEEGLSGGRLLRHSFAGTTSKFRL